MPDDITQQNEVNVPGAGESGGDSLNEQVALIIAEIAKHPEMSLDEKKEKLEHALELMNHAAPAAPEPPAEGPPAEETQTESEDEDKDKNKDEDDMSKEDDRDEAEKAKEKEEENSVEEAIIKLKATDDPKNKELAESLGQKLKSARDKRSKYWELKAEEGRKYRRGLAEKLCNESALPKKCITEFLINKMTQKRTEKEMKLILEDRLAFVNVKQPTSGPGYMGRNFDNPGSKKDGKDISTDDFVNTLKGKK